MTVRILEGDALALLRTLPDASVQTCITSPPYWGLRDYGVDGQIGLESTPEEFVARLVEVFREVRRVLADDGTCWVNLGDSYGRGTRTSNPLDSRRGTGFHATITKNLGYGAGAKTAVAGKQLQGIPWRVAFALQADGWYLRQDIIWSKPNPMPESVRDRCTKAHEYLFLLSKRERYYFDADAIRETAVSSWDPNDTKAPDGWDTGPGGHGTIHRQGREAGKSGNKARQPASARDIPADTDGSTNGAVAGSVPWEGTTRNKRSVWTVATQPFAEAHFATFPPALIEPCVLAGSRPGDIVLDPFGGAGTTGLVADRLGRDAILVELNPDYAAMARRRIDGDVGHVSRTRPLFAEAAT